MWWGWGWCRGVGGGWGGCLCRSGLGVGVIVMPRYVLWCVDQVQAAIHANTTHLPYPWSQCSNIVDYSRFDLLTSMLPVYRCVWVHGGLGGILKQGRALRSGLPRTHTRVPVNRKSSVVGWVCGCVGGVWACGWRVLVCGLCAAVIVFSVGRAGGGGGGGGRCATAQ